MAQDKFADVNFKWENIRVLVAQATSFARARETSQGIAGTTLQSSIAEAIVELDSAAVDAIDAYGDGAVILDNASGLQDAEGNAIGVQAYLLSGTDKGKLQKVRDLRLLFFGDGSEPGVLDQLRALADPEV